MAASNSDRPRTLNDLLSNKDFIELEQITRRPNIFEALNIAEYEVRHSTFLSYLLDPNETHGMGTGFLESFLLRTSIHTDENNLNIRELDLDMTKVTREWSLNNQENTRNNRLDILLEIPKKTANDEKLIIGIECKINSKQGVNQLEIYKEMLKDHQKTENGKVIHLFLTKFEEEAPDDWYEVKFQGLVTESLDITMKKYGSIMSEKVHSFLGDYKQILDQDEGTSEKGAIAERLAKDYGLVIKDKGVKDYLAIKHKHAYEALAIAIYAQEWRYTKELKKCVEERGFLKEGVEPKSENTILRFYPSSSYPADSKYCGLDSYAKEWAGGKYPILFEIHLKKQVEEIGGGASDRVTLRPYLFLCLGPLKEVTLEERKHLVMSIRDAISSSAQKEIWGWQKRKITSDFTRVLKSRSYGDSEINEGNAGDIIEQMVDQAKDAADLIRSVIEQSAIGKKVR